MRFASLLACLGLLVVAAPAHGQTYLIVVDGTLADGTGSFSDVPVGTPYVFTQTFDASTAVLVSSDATDATYSDPNGSSSITVGGSIYSGSAPQIEVTSGTLSSTVPGALPLYGYEFSQDITGGGFAAQVFSTDSSVAPDTSLNHLQTFSPDSFNNAVIDLTDGYFYGTNTTFSVEIEQAPEPSSVALWLLSVVALGCLRYRRQRSNITG